MNELGSILGIGIAFIGGVLSFASPCCLPLVPAYLGYMMGATGEGTTGRRPAFLHGLSFVIGFSLVVMIAIALFGRDSQFLDAYDSAIGQLVLLLIATAFGVGMLWLSRLTRFERPARFLSIGGDR